MSNFYEKLESTLASQGAFAAVEKLNAELLAAKDYHNLFYGLLLRTRLELGLSPVAIGPASTIPEPLQVGYEEGIRLAARTAGAGLLAVGDLAGAWPYYRMIREPEPMIQALAAARPAAEDAEAWQNLIGIAWNEGVAPKLGFDRLLERFGTCSAITSFGQTMPEDEDTRNHCIRALVRNVYAETCERVRAELVKKESQYAFEQQPLVTLLAGRDWLFDDDAYHIDLSHLSSVVQYSIHLPDCPELELAIALCEYGKNLSPRYLSPGDPPFEDHYRDFSMYLRAIAGHAVDEGVAHFRGKAEACDPHVDGTLPAEVLVNLLVRVGRPRDAVCAFSRYLGKADPRRLSCPDMTQLCYQAGDFEAYKELALRQGNLVNFTAGLLQTKAQGQGR